MYSLGVLNETWLFLLPLKKAVFRLSAVSVEMVVVGKRVQREIFMFLRVIFKVFNFTSFLNFNFQQNSICSIACGLEIKAISDKGLVCHGIFPNYPHLVWMWHFCYKWSRNTDMPLWIEATVCIRIPSAVCGDDITQ